MIIKFTCFKFTGAVPVVKSEGMVNCNVQVVNFKLFKGSSECKVTKHTKELQG